MLVAMNTDNLVLRPNCLMTKYPLVFITGLRSLFYHKKLASDLQDFIAAHGYVVLSPVMPFRSKELRQLQLKKWLSQQTVSTFHFILGEDTYAELQAVFTPYSSSSFTLIPRDLKHKESTPSPSLQYCLHQIFCRLTGNKAEAYEQVLPYKSLEFYDRFLDHCIELAENEDL